MHLVDPVEQVRDVGGRRGGVRAVQLPVGVGGADDPVPAPRDDEEHRPLASAGSGRRRRRSPTAGRQCGRPWTPGPADPGRYGPPPATIISVRSSLHTPVAAMTVRAATSKALPRLGVDRADPGHLPGRAPDAGHLGRRDDGRAEARRRTGERGDQAGVVDLRVVVADRAPDRVLAQGREGATGLRRREVPVQRHAATVAEQAGERVVRRHTGAVVAAQQPAAARPNGAGAAGRASGAPGGARSGWRGAHAHAMPRGPGRGRAAPGSAGHRGRAWSTGRRCRRPGREPPPGRPRALVTLRQRPHRHR